MPRMNTEAFKKSLEEELWEVENELKTVGEQSKKTGDWEGKEQDMDVVSPLADSNEAADKIEEYDENRAVNDELEVRYNEIKHALERIQKGTYGSCEVCSAPIEEERLNANAAARTCLAHKDEEYDRPLA